jgi:hypothetical protein
MECFQIDKRMGSFRDNTATRIFKAIEWYEAKLQQTLLEIEGNFEKYRISEALMELTSWYGMIFALGF